MSHGAAGPGSNLRAQSRGMEQLSRFFVPASAVPSHTLKHNRVGHKNMARCQGDQWAKQASPGRAAKQRPCIHRTAARAGTYAWQWVPGVAEPSDQLSSGGGCPSSCRGASETLQSSQPRGTPGVTHRCLEAPAQIPR